MEVWGNEWLCKKKMCFTISVSYLIIFLTTICHVQLNVPSVTSQETKQYKKNPEAQ